RRGAGCGVMSAELDDDRGSAARRGQLPAAPMQAVFPASAHARLAPLAPRPLPFGSFRAPAMRSRVVCNAVSRGAPVRRRGRPRRSMTSSLAARTPRSMTFGVPRHEAGAFFAVGIGGTGVAALRGPGRGPETLAAE